MGERKNENQGQLYQEQSDSLIYLERTKIERICSDIIEQPGGLLRISSPQKMGKSLLLNRILEYKRKQDYIVIKIHLNIPGDNILNNYESFLKWLFCHINKHYHMNLLKENHWNKSPDSNYNCTNYFEDNLLLVIQKPLVLAIDNFERLFEYEKLFDNFCRLLRSWHDMSKQNDALGKIWKKFRLVLVYSTDDYPKLNINHSPFNVGFAQEISGFDELEIKELVKRYNLDKQLQKQDLARIRKLFEGHPYLIQKTFEYLKKITIQNHNIFLEKFLKLAATEEGIFRTHLRQLFCDLKNEPELEIAYKKILLNQDPVFIKCTVGFKLKSLGLVKTIGNGYAVSCDLYRQYFSVHLVGQEVINE